MDDFGKITADNARDYFRFFQIHLAPNARDDSTFLEASSHILGSQSDFIMNEFLVAFMEHSRQKTVSSLKWVMISEAPLKRLCFYLNVRNLELRSRDAEVTFSTVWRWFDDCRRSPVSDVSICTEYAFQISRFV